MFYHASAFWRYCNATENMKKGLNTHVIMTFLFNPFSRHHKNVLGCFCCFLGCLLSVPFCTPNDFLNIFWRQFWCITLVASLFLLCTFLKPVYRNVSFSRFTYFRGDDSHLTPKYILRALRGSSLTHNTCECWTLDQDWPLEKKKCALSVMNTKLDSCTFLILHREAHT